MNTQTAPTLTKEELIRELLETRRRMQEEGAFAVAEQKAQQYNEPAQYASQTGEQTAAASGIQRGYAGYQQQNTTPQPTELQTSDDTPAPQSEPQAVPQVAPEPPAPPAGQPSPYTPSETDQQTEPPAPSEQEPQETPVPATAPSAPVGADPYREPVEEESTTDSAEMQISHTPAPEEQPPQPSISEPLVTPMQESPMQSEQQVEQMPENVPPEVAPDMQADMTVPEQTVPANAALMQPEVQKGLEQLLSEWDIFKKSGIFGFGGNGIDHPTYKKIAQLPTMAVISGRWEGADPALTENIKEYMEGWEQEQGITADPEETFETYLRRVIAHILNVQV